MQCRTIKCSNEATDSQSPHITNSGYCAECTAREISVGRRISDEIARKEGEYFRSMLHLGAWGNAWSRGEYADYLVGCESEEKR